MRRAIYAGSFDPLTNGHIDIIRRGLGLFDEIVVALAINVRKTPLFSLDERVAFIQQAFPDDPVKACGFNGLLVEFAAQQQCQTMLRGLRSVGDFEYELKMTTMNSHLAPNIETIFLMTDEEHSFVSSSLIKEVARFGGDVSKFVPPHVAQALSRVLSSS